MWDGIRLMAPARTNNVPIIGSSVQVPVPELDADLMELLPKIVGAVVPPGVLMVYLMQMMRDSKRIKLSLEVQHADKTAG